MQTSCAPSNTRTPTATTPRRPASKITPPTCSMAKSSIDSDAAALLAFFAQLIQSALPTMKLRHSLLLTALSVTAGAAFGATTAENWDNFCAKCHGPDGAAKTVVGKKLKLKDYTDAK